MNFYQKYLLLCNSIKKTPSAVAEEIGSTRASATRWKHGSRPTDAVLQRIALYFDVDVKYFDESDDSTTSNIDPEIAEILSLLSNASGQTKKAAIAAAKAVLKSGE